MLEFGLFLVPSSAVLTMKPSLTNIIRLSTLMTFLETEILVVHSLPPQRLVGSLLCAGRQGVLELFVFVVCFFVLVLP